MRLQVRREHPLIPPELFREMRTAAPYLGGVLLGTTIYGVDTFVPLFVQGARGGTAGRRRRRGDAAGLPVGGLGDRSRARLIVRFGFRKTARWGALLILAGFVA